MATYYPIYYTIALCYYFPVNNYNSTMTQTHHKHNRNQTDQCLYVVTATNNESRNYFKSLITKTWSVTYGGTTYRIFSCFKFSWISAVF